MSLSSSVRTRRGRRWAILEKLNIFSPFNPIILIWDLNASNENFSIQAWEVDNNPIGYVYSVLIWGLHYFRGILYILNAGNTIRRYIDTGIYRKVV